MDAKRLWLVICAASLGAVALVASGAAQDEGASSMGHAVVSESRREGEYAGVRADGRGQPPRVKGATRGRARLLTWPGFAPNEQAGGGRFFLQLSKSVQPQTRSSEGRFELVLRNVRTHLRNTRRPLITRYFNTPVVIAKVERRRRDLVVVFQLRSPSTPNVTTAAGEGGFHFVYVDFPAGQYLPEELARERRPPSMAPSVASSMASQ